MSIHEIEELGTKLAEKTREAELYFSLIDSASLVLCVVDREKFIKVNQTLCNHLGVTKSYLEGAVWTEFIHPEDVSSVNVATRQMDKEPLSDFHSRLRRADGSYALFSWSAFPWTEEGVTVSIGRFLQNG